MDLTNLMDDFMLQKIADVLPSPLNIPIRAISARFSRLVVRIVEPLCGSRVDPRATMTPFELRNFGVRTDCILMLKVAHANGCPWNESTCMLAAEFGRFDMLKWLCARGCPWDGQTCAHAAFNGHLDILKWARANGCPWDGRTCSEAAWGGHLDCLVFAHENGCPWDGELCANARSTSHYECLEYALKNGCPDDYEGYHSD